jgi:hypothetical protein
MVTLHQKLNKKLQNLKIKSIHLNEMNKKQSKIQLNKAEIMILRKKRKLQKKNQKKKLRKNNKHHLNTRKYNRKKFNKRKLLRLNNPRQKLINSLSRLKNKNTNSLSK